MKRTLTPALLVALAAGLAQASPGQQTALDLVSGKQTPAKAATTWAKAGISPAQALKVLQVLPKKKVVPGAQKLTLHDPAGRDSEIRIHMPKETLPNGRYGVILTLHGYGGHAGQLMFFAKKVAPKGFIVVAPNARRLSTKLENEDVPPFARQFTARMRHWWTYKKASFPLLALEHIKKNFPIDTNRVVVLGYSMGGYGTWNVGLRYHDKFAAIVPLAGGISRLENIVPRDERSRKLLQNGVMVPSFFVHGSADRVVPCRFSRTIAAELKKLGAPHVYTEVEGGQHILRGFLKGNEITTKLIGWLKQRKRNPSPRKVTHTALGKYHGSAYWVRVDALSANSGSVTAEIKPGNRIEVQLARVKKLTLFLDPKLIDVEQDVTVTIDGVVVHKGRVEPSLKAVAESFGKTRDPRLTYRHALELKAPGEQTRFF